MKTILWHQDRGMDTHKKTAILGGDENIIWPHKLFSKKALRNVADALYRALYILRTITYYSDDVLEYF